VPLKGIPDTCSFPPFLLPLCHVSLVTSSRHHYVPPDHGPRMNGAKDYGLKSLKPLAKINLPSLSGVSLRYFSQE
jgi:hypothetical protein